MRSFPLLALCLLVPVAAFALPVSGNGAVRTEERRLSGFSAIDMGGVGELVIEKGASFTVSVSLDSNLLPLYESRVEDGVLYLGFRSGSTALDITRLEVSVTLPDLEALALSGAADARLGDGVSARSLYIEISGTGRVSGELDCERLSAELSGAGKLELSGRAREFALDISGTGSLEGRELGTESARIAISGAGSARIGVSRSLEAEVSGAGSVRYWGNPRVVEKVSGVGTVSRGGD